MNLVTRGMGALGVLPTGGFGYSADVVVVVKVAAGRSDTTIIPDGNDDDEVMIIIKAALRWI